MTLLAQLLKPESVLVPLQASSKKEAVDRMVDFLAARGYAGDREDLRGAIWKRERAGSTGIGYGIAVPHAKTADCSELCLAVGLTESPIEFDSMDGAPVRLVFIMASPLDQTGPHIKALAEISRVLTDEAVRRRALRARTAEALHKVLTSANTV